MGTLHLQYLTDEAVQKQLGRYVDWDNINEGELPKIDLSSFNSFSDVEAFIADTALVGEEGERVATVLLELLTIDTLRSKDRETVKLVGEMLQKLLNSDKTEHAFLVVNAVSELGILIFKPFLPMMLQSAFGPDVIKDAVEKLDEREIGSFVKALSNKGSALSLLAITSVVENVCLKKMLPYFPDGIIPYFVALALKAPQFDEVVKKLIKADCELNGINKLDRWIKVFLLNLRDLSNRLVTSEQTTEDSKAELGKIRKLLASFNLTKLDWVISSSNDEPPDDSEILPVEYVDAMSTTELEDCLMERYPERLAKALAQYPYSKRKN